MLVAALVAVATIAAPASGQDRSAIQDLLDRRAAAIRDRDRAAFAATILPGEIFFRARQLRMFDRMRNLEFASYRLVVRWDRWGDLASPSDRSRYGDADAVVIPVTEERYRLAGYDRDEVVEELFYTFVERDGRWYIASDTDLDDLTLYSARHPWDFARLTQQRSGHFLLLEPACAGCTRAPPAALVLAEVALARVKGYWSAPWRKRMPLVIPTSSADLKRMLQLTFDVEDFVAFAASTVDFDDGIDYTGHRIILNPDQFVGRPQESTLDILAHEILHIATRKSSGPFVPTWVEEGIAEYVRHEADPSTLAIVYGAGSGQGLPEHFEFTTGSGYDIYVNYQRAYSAVRYFIQRWGLKSFIRFYRRLGRIEVAPGLADYHVDRALRASIDMGLNRFERAWASSIDAP
jgi:hypothetical protein